MGKLRQEDPWGLLVSQSSCICKLYVQWKICLKKKVESDWGRCPVSTSDLHIDGGSHTHTHVNAHTHTEDDNTVLVWLAKIILIISHLNPEEWSLLRILI